jgi:hypothetical protein
MAQLMLLQQHHFSNQCLWDLAAAVVLLHAAPLLAAPLQGRAAAAAAVLLLPSPASLADQAVLLP